MVALLGVMLHSMLAQAVAADHSVKMSVAGNPVRKVVNLLQSMQKKVMDEGEREKELYEKFMCYCKTGGGDLSTSISAGEDKIPSVSSSIEAAEASLTQAKENLKQAQIDRSAAKDAISEATSLREKEATAFASYKSDAETNIAAISKAVAALEKGAAGGFLQTDAAAVIRHAVEKSSLVEADQQELLAFLSQQGGYAPQSGEITGLLKQLGDEMSSSLAEATGTEKNAIKNFNALVAAKTKEIAATTSTIEAKTQQIGELGVSMVQMKEDLTDTQAALAEDQKFLAELKKSCATKTSEWEERSKTRADELVAIADTIKVLNDDDALELFKKTLPSSFVQVEESRAAMRVHALAVLRRASASAAVSDRPGLQLLAMALAGKKASNSGGFDKVIHMIDNMVQILGKEQLDDDHKKEYCEAQHDLAEDKAKDLSREVDQQQNAIATTKEAIATLAEEIAALQAGIKSLDQAVAQATQQRRDENNEFKAVMAADTAAREVLNFAKNRLNKFYNPKLYKPAPKVELSSEDRIYSNMGGVVTTAPPGGIADTGITVLAQVSVHEKEQDAPAPPPATWDAYAKKGQESGGVIAMIDLLIKDLAKEMTEATTDENNAQVEYQQMMQDAADKRAADSSSLTSKTASKADLEAQLQGHEEQHTGASKELQALLKYHSALHAECDWLLQYFDVRKEARAGEMDSLKQAKAVLSGADFAFVQVRKHGFLKKAWV